MKLFICPFEIQRLLGNYSENKIIYVNLSIDQYDRIVWYERKSKHER